MCKIEECDRHEFDYGYCLPHLKDAWIADGTLVIEDAPEQTTKIDAVEVNTTDAAVEIEERTDDE